MHKIVRQDRSYTVADREWKKLVSLPCHPGMTQEDIDYVIYWVKEFYGERRISCYDGKNAVYYGVAVIEDWYVFGSL